MQIGRWLHDREEAIGERGMVAAKRRPATEAGARMLEQGGNAVDAAIAAAFVSGVVEPMMSGLGGGGVMIVHDPADGRDWCVDFGNRGPALAAPGCWELEEGRSAQLFKWRKVKDDANITGHRAAGVPGAVAGYLAAHGRWGRLPLRTIVEPAIRAAAEGVTVDWYHAGLVRNELERLRRNPAAATIFLEGGDPPQPRTHDRAGARLRQPDLARTLEEIATGGAAAFYRGHFARALDEEMRAGGGLVRAEDLAAYEARILPALTVPYRGVRVATVPGPFGGVTLAGMLRILDGFDLTVRGRDTAAALHLIAESSRLAFADRFAHLADPEVVPTPLAGLLAEAYIAERRALIDPARALSQVAPGDPWAHEPGGRPAAALARGSGTSGLSSNTTHLCAADRDGLAVSLTSTLGSSFGCAVTIPGTGVTLNNVLGWFDPEPGRPASIGPSRRPLTNQTPAIVVDAQGARLAAGASGGRRILDCVAQLIVKTVDYGLGPQAAIGGPRLDCSEGPLTIDARVGPAALAGLAALGHEVVAVEPDFFNNPFASPDAILFDRASGCLRGGADQLYPAVAIGV